MTWAVRYGRNCLPCLQYEWGVALLLSIGGFWLLEAMAITVTLTVSRYSTRSHRRGVQVPKRRSNVPMVQPHFLDNQVFLLGGQNYDGPLDTAEKMVLKLVNVEPRTPRPPSLSISGSRSSESRKA
mmetsp:Transcript_11779/g.27301  ORF Transcript_11779/g.27301 Transcript_11779/m.27301 type:complete len:126 (+) Transcript_11779:1345-1722(+)